MQTECAGVISRVRVPDVVKFRNSKSFLILCRVCPFCKSCVRVSERGVLLFDYKGTGTASLLPLIVDGLN